MPAANDLRLAQSFQPQQASRPIYFTAQAKLASCRRDFPWMLAKEKSISWGYAGLSDLAHSSSGSQGSRLLVSRLEARHLATRGRSRQKTSRLRYNPGRQPRTVDKSNGLSDYEFLLGAFPAFPMRQAGISGT
jgi:hypothetical protein